MRNIVLSAGLLGLVTLFFVSCGGYVGAPGSTGANETNVFWEETEVTPRDLAAATSSVDIANSSDVTCAEGPEPVERNHFADIVFRCHRIWRDRAVGDQIITSYRIDYDPLTAGAPPIAPLTNSMSVTLTITNAGTGEASVANAVFFDAQSKAAFPRSEAASFPQYIANFTFFGRDSFGNPFSFKGSAVFTVGIFGNCANVLVDVTAPPVPTGLGVANITSSSVSLFWNPVSAPDLAGYRVYRNGAFIDNAITNAFADAGLASSATYFYNVTSFDNSPAANESAPSDTVEVTTLP